MILQVIPLFLKCLILLVGGYVKAVGRHVKVLGKHVKVVGRYVKVSDINEGLVIANKFRYVNNGTNSPTLDEIEEIGRLFSEGVYV